MASSRAHGHAPFAAIAPDLTWHVAGLAKCIGAGLRAAYVVVPDTRSAWPFAAALRAATVMASPFTVALATRWIEDGTADTLLRFIRSRNHGAAETGREILPKGIYKRDPLELQHLAVELPAPWNRAAFVDHMRSTGSASSPATPSPPMERRRKRSASASAARSAGHGSPPGSNT